MARIVITETADADTASILAYLGRVAGYGLTCKYQGLFESLYDRLSDHPESGALRPRLGKEIRMGFVSPYIILYRYDRVADNVFILRLLHYRQRAPRQLF